MNFRGGDDGTGFRCRRPAQIGVGQYDLQVDRLAKYIVGFRLILGN